MSFETKAPGAPDKKLQEEEERYLPPRKSVHPSEKGVWARRFYLTLFWLFILLTAGLFAWGWTHRQ
jgi:hypothetical protein